VEDDVQMLPPFPSVVLPGPDPEGPDSLSAKPCRDPVPEISEEHVQALRRVDIEMQRVKVEGRVKWLAYMPSETVCTQGILALL
jgi:hypothetical protein